MEDYKILILALQETRFKDEIVVDSDSYRIFKGKKGWNPINNKGIPHLGTGFVVDKRIVNAVSDFYSPHERLSLINLRCMNKTYTLINGHAPINEDNRKNPEKLEKFWESLEYELSKIPVKNIKVLLGDFNAQIGNERKFRKIAGEYPAHKRTNRNGERLIEICRGFNLKLMSTHFKKLPSKQKTWKSPNPALGEFQIDHVAISFVNQKEIMNVKVRKGANIESDHYLTTIKMKFIPLKKVKHNNRSVPRINTEKLTFMKSEFQTKLGVESKEWNVLKTNLVTAAYEVAPLKKNKKHRWWNNQCEDAIGLRLSAWKTWHSTKKVEDYNSFKTQRSATAKVIRMVKRNYEKSRLLQIDEDFKKNNTRSFYRIFKQELQEFQPPSLCFKNSDGILVLNNRDNCALLADYFRDLLNCDEPKERLPIQIPDHKHPNTKPPDLTELQHIIKGLQNNKAPGEDFIISEMWKNVSKETVQNLQEIITKIWDEEKVPEEWKRALIHPIHKKGDKSDPNNYRGISLLPVTYKIFAKALLNRLETQLDQQIGEYQGGFRKGRSCVEQILNLKSVIKYRRLRSKDLFIIFVDFKKAYDSIDRESLFNILVEFGVDDKTIAILKQVLNETISSVKFMGEISEPFEVGTGVRQGDGLSPLLFNCVLEKVVREWRKLAREKGIREIVIGRKKNNLKIDCLAFADDLAILAEDAEDAIELINILYEVAVKTGLQISFQKTMFMSNKNSAPNHLSTKYGRITKVNKFKYLGEIIQPNAADKEAKLARSRKMEIAFHITRQRYNKKSVSTNAKLRHYNSVIKPEALYASECLTLGATGKLLDLEKKERKVIRSILGPTFDNGIWKLRSNNDIYDRIEKITDTIRKRRVTFYGHIKRMKGDRLTKKIFDYFDKNPKTQLNWFKEIRRDLEEMGLTKADVLNRSMFRKCVKSFRGFKETKKRTTGVVWSDVRRNEHSARMKTYWMNKKQRRGKSS